MEYEIVLPELHLNQQVIKDSQSRFKVLCCGRRWGKTSLAIDLIVDAMLSGKRTAYMAQSYKTIHTFWDNIYKVVEPIIEYKNKTRHEIKIVTDGYLICWSLKNPDNMRGNAYDVVVVDEASFTPNLYDKWEGAIRPTLMDYMGKALIMSTPRGMNDFYKFFLMGKDSNVPSWESWQFPTLTNPHIHPNEIEEARLTTSKTYFAQEYLAQFTSIEGTTFRNISEVSILEGNQEPVEGDIYVAGIDWGQANDYTVISIISCSERKQVYLDRFNGVSWAIQRARIKNAVEKYKPQIVLAEQNSIGSVLLENLREEGVDITGFITSNSSKNRIIQQLALAMEKKELELINDYQQIGELEMFETYQNKTGMTTYGAPSGHHDDTVMALAIAYHAMISSGSSMVVSHRNLYRNPRDSHQATHRISERRPNNVPLLDMVGKKRNV